MKRYRVIAFGGPWWRRLWRWVRRDPYEWRTLPEAAFMERMERSMLEGDGYLYGISLVLGDDTVLEGCGMCSLEIFPGHGHRVHAADWSEFGPTITREAKIAWEGARVD